MSGSSEAKFGDDSKGTYITWNIGAKGIDSQFAGTVKGPGCKINKVGQGTLTLKGANTYTGGTTVSGGTLLVANASGSATGTGAVKVQSGASLTGTGHVAGTVTVYSGGIVSLENQSVGTLTFASDLTFQQGATLVMEVNTSTEKSDLLKIGRNLTLKGTLSLKNLAAGSSFASGQQFKVVEVAATATGSFDSIVPVLSAPLQWNQQSLVSDGILKIVSPEALPSVGDNEVASVQYFDLLGNPITEAGQLGNAHCLVICRILYKNGTFKVQKRLLKPSEMIYF